MRKVYGIRFGSSSLRVYFEPFFSLTQNFLRFLVEDVGRFTDSSVFLEKNFVKTKAKVLDLR